MKPAERLAYIDWLRILAIIGVLFFHSAMPYVAEWDWHIRNKETSNLLMECNFWLSRFRMPLLFFVSGAVAQILLRKYTTAGFIKMRFQRLFIPLLFGMLLLVPLQVYMERAANGYKGSFFSFYPSIFTTGPYPEGNLSWHHLWFIAYLLVYDILLAPLLRWMVQHKQNSRFFSRLAQGRWIYIIMIPSVVLFTALVRVFPETHDLIHDWCYHFYWMFFLLAGFICMNQPALMDSLERNRRNSLALAFLSFLLINYLRWNNLEPEKDALAVALYPYLSLYPLTAWFWVMAAMGYGKRYLNKTHSSLAYINTAGYPFYILHQTVIVVLAYYIVQTTDTVLMKYLFTTALTFFTCVVLIHLLIRPFAPMRFLFGMKERKGLSETKKECRETGPVKNESLTAAERL